MHRFAASFHSLRRVAPGACLLGLTQIALAQPAPAPAASAPLPTVADCTAIGAAADRLACYDKLAGRAPQGPADVTRQMPQGEPTAAKPGESTPSLLTQKDQPLSPATQPRSESSLLSKFWELDAQDKRGTFNLSGYRSNYLMPVHVTTRINRAPQSPSQAPVSSPDYRKVEAKFQISLRAKLLQDVLIDDADLWFGFTQQALWQIYNGADSKPFRNTDYEPELMYVVPTGKGWQALPLGWKWRYTQLGLAHQSNGQSDPLSRSWNRVYGVVGFERGAWSILARMNKRIREDVASDNNPDLIDYRGRGELQTTWASGPTTLSVTYRSSLKSSSYGSLQLEYSYPVFHDQPNGVRWFVQAFHGYGETLTDYNFRQTSLGAGLSFLQF
jgi:phospholipase A1